MNVLMIGPSCLKSKGGMATVIKEIVEDKAIFQNINIDTYDSYIDGNKIKVLLFSFMAILKFIICGKARKYDVYHIHVASNGSTFRKIIYAKLVKRNNKKLILHIHGGQYMDFYKSLSTKKKKAVEDFLKSADIVIALSNKWKSNFENTFNLDNCVSIENGIDTEKYKLGINYIDNLNRNFIFLGRICKEKGIYDLLQAVSIARNKYNDICCYIGGVGEDISEDIEKLHIEKNIKLLGWLEEDRKIEVLRQVNTLVLPSYYEALPMCILESMACGKAIISTNVGAIPEVVKEENGILINAGDVKALANAIIKCCSNKEYMNSVSKNNINKIEEQFSMETMHRQILKCYREL